MMSMLNLLWIVPLCVAAGFTLAALAWTAGDPHPEQDESHSATRYAQDDYIDWSKVPAWADWCLVQPSGCPIACEKEPHIEPEAYGTGWWKETSCDGRVYVARDAIIGPLPPWRESLRKRPA